jgi:coenzyme Q-binding protein COQ10
MYTLVANVDDYRLFVPWCTESRFVNAAQTRADLAVGFMAFTERYTSVVTRVPPSSVLARAADTGHGLFKTLDTSWKFADGGGGTCIVDFSVTFEFRSKTHGALAGLFFEQVAEKMVGAFESRAAQMYGPPKPARGRMPSIRSS